LHNAWRREAEQGNLTNKFDDTEPNPAQVMLITGSSNIGNYKEDSNNSSSNSDQVDERCFMFNDACITVTVILIQ